MSTTNCQREQKPRDAIFSIQYILSMGMLYAHFPKEPKESHFRPSKWPVKDAMQLLDAHSAYPWCHWGKATCLCRNIAVCKPLKCGNDHPQHLLWKRRNCSDLQHRGQLQVHNRLPAGQQQQKTPWRLHQGIYWPHPIPKKTNAIAITMSTAQFTYLWSQVIKNDVSKSQIA